MLYSYINDIDVNDKFFYIIIIIASTFFSGSIIKPSGTVVVGLVVGILVVYYINDKRESHGDTFISSMKEILDSHIMFPGKNEYLPKNSELVMFLEGYKEYYDYNPDLWKSFVSVINNYLKIIHEIDIGTKYYNLDYNVVKEYKTKVLNHYHSFIHSIPHAQSALDKFHSGFKTLEDHLNVEIEKTHQLVAQKNSKQITTASVFHYKNHPSGLVNSKITDYDQKYKYLL